MSIRRKHGLDFGSLGVVIGVLAVVSVLAAVTVMNIIRHERGDDVTWVG